MAPEAQPFRDVHRHARWMVLLRTGVALGVGAAIVGVCAVASAAAPAVVVAAVAERPPDSLPEPEPTAMVPAAPVVTVPVAAPPIAATWNIGIDTTGYQAELDACLWVRMDLDAAAPIVGAHNSCGGDVVLRMAIGDTVTLSGTALDGTYTVVEARDARAGDSAASATEGMLADVILQTCYWHSNGRERLLALHLV